MIPPRNSEHARLQPRTFSSSLGRIPRVAPCSSPLPLGYLGVLNDVKIKYLTLQYGDLWESNLGPLILKILGVRTQERTLRTPVRTLKRLRDSYSLTHFSTISLPIGLKCTLSSACTFPHHHQQHKRAIIFGRSPRLQMKCSWPLTGPALSPSSLERRTMMAA